MSRIGWCRSRKRRAVVFIAVLLVADLNFYAAKSDELIDNIHDIARKLQNCWVAPPLGLRSGIVFSVRASFRGTGELLGIPIVHFQTPNLSEAEKNRYRSAVADMFKRCSPLHFSYRLASGIAGHPIILRFIEGQGGSSSI